jgi:hypothetical protein
MYVTCSGGKEVEIVGRRRLTQLEARRAMVKEMLILRRAGYTNEEIGMKYRYHPTTVSKMVNSIPPEAVERMHAVGLA